MNTAKHKLTIEDAIMRTEVMIRVMTATEIAMAINEKLSSVSSTLTKLVKQGDLKRIQAQGPRGGWGYAYNQEGPGEVANDEIEQLRVQLAGCGVAAMGGTTEPVVATPHSYGWSASYQSILDLRRSFDRMSLCLREFLAVQGLGDEHEKKALQELKWAFATRHDKSETKADVLCSAPDEDLLAQLARVEERIKEAEKSSRLTRTKDLTKPTP